MKLESVKLKNFRGYRTETIISILDLTAFIGKNEAIKSALGWKPAFPSFRSGLAE